MGGNSSSIGEHAKICSLCMQLHRVPVLLQWNAPVQSMTGGRQSDSILYDPLQRSLVLAELLGIDHVTLYGTHKTISAGHKLCNMITRRCFAVKCVT